MYQVFTITEEGQHIVLASSEDKDIAESFLKSIMTERPDEAFAIFHKGEILIYEI